MVCRQCDSEYELLTDADIYRNSRTAHKKVVSPLSELSCVHLENFGA